MPQVSTADNPRVSKQASPHGTARHRAARSYTSQSRLSAHASQKGQRPDWPERTRQIRTALHLVASKVHVDSSDQIRSDLIGSDHIFVKHTGIGSIKSPDIPIHPSIQYTTISLYCAGTMVWYRDSIFQSSTNQPAPVAHYTHTRGNKRSVTSKGAIIYHDPSTT